MALERTAVEQVIALAAGMGVPTDARPSRPFARPGPAKRPPLGAAPRLGYTVPDLFWPLVRVLGPAILRLRARLGG
jgi:hypothetical protein